MYLSRPFLIPKSERRAKCQKSLSPGNENFEMRPDKRHMFLPQVKTLANAEKNSWETPKGGQRQENTVQKFVP
jgi:hypothetical protein